jgi:hypothetical protein
MTKLPLVQRANVVHSFIKTMGRSTSNRTELLSCLHQSIVEYYTIEDLQLWLRRPNPPPPDSTFYQAVFRTRIVLNELGDIMSIEYASEDDQKLLGQGLGFHSPDQDGAEAGVLDVLAALDKQNQVLETLTAKLEAGEVQSAREIEAELELASVTSPEAGRPVEDNKPPARAYYKVPAEDFLAGRLVWRNDTKFLVCPAATSPRTRANRNRS